MTSFLYLIYSYACCHSKSLKKNRQGPEHLLPFSMYLLTVCQAQVPTASLSIDTSVKTISQNLELLMVCRPAGYRRGKVSNSLQ